MCTEFNKKTFGSSIVVKDSRYWKIHYRWDYNNILCPRLKSRNTAVVMMLSFAFLPNQIKKTSIQEDFFHDLSAYSERNTLEEKCSV